MFIGSAAVGMIGASVIGAVAGGSASRAGARASDASAEATRAQSDIAKEQWNRYKSIYAPIEDKYAQDAQNSDSATNSAKAAGAASSTVTDQFSKARARLARTPGMDPSTAAYTASLTGLDMAQAATDATQQNAARQGVQDTAWARKTDALSLGKGMPAQATAGLSSAAATAANQASNQYALAGQQGANAGQFASNLWSAGEKAGWFNPSLNTAAAGASSLSAIEGAAKLPPIRL